MPFVLKKVKLTKFDVKARRMFSAAQSNETMGSVELPPDMWKTVLSFAPDAATFGALARASKQTASAARGLQGAMKKRFAQETFKTALIPESTEAIHLTQRDRVFVLPDGTKHGSFRRGVFMLFHSEWRILVLEEGEYSNGKREGVWITWDAWKDNGAKEKLWEDEYRSGTQVRPRSFTKFGQKYSLDHP